jgi:hypothetical protein
MHSITYNFASHIDSTTLADGDYQLIPEPEGVCSEEHGSLVAEFSEAPNQGSENISLTNPSLTIEGKPRTYPLFYLHSRIILFIYVLLH